MTGSGAPQLMLGLALLALFALVGAARWQLDSRLRMAQAHAHFTEAVRVARTKLSEKAFSDGQPLASTGEWIALFNSQALLAPEGGPAFIVNRSGSPETGAIGVSATDYGNEVHIARPSYRVLHNHKVVVTHAGLTHQPPLPQLAES